MKKISKKSLIVSILTIVIFAALSLGGFLMLEERKENIQKEKVRQEEMEKEGISQEEKEKEQDPVEAIKDLIEGEYEFQKVDTSNWKTYRNEEMGFKVKIPKDWEMKSMSKFEWCNYFEFEGNKKYNMEESEVYPVIISICDEERYISPEKHLLNWKKSHNIRIWRTEVINLPAYYYSGFSEGLQIPNALNEKYSVSIISNVLCQESLCGPSELRQILHGMIMTFKFI